MSQDNLKCVFFVQGEGNGHLSEAVALYELLYKHNYTVSAFVIGNRNSMLSNSIRKNIKCPIYHVQSFNKVSGNNNRRISRVNSIYFLLKHFGSYFKSIKTIRKVILTEKPDIIFNFYEPLIGLYTFLYGKRMKFVSIGHQYLNLHSEFKLPYGHLLKRVCLKYYSKFTAYNSDRIWALSSFDLSQDKKQKIVVVPPLLRQDILNMDAAKGNFLLVYLSHSGYVNEIIHWHHTHPNEIVHCFIDFEKYTPAITSPNFFFHPLSNKKFLQKLGNCKGIICNSGFETMCESMYLDKPILVIPIENHFGQFCNSIVSFPQQILVYKEFKDFDRFVAAISTSTVQENGFNTWADRAEDTLLRELRLLKQCV